MYARKTLSGSKTVLLILLALTLSNRLNSESVIYFDEEKHFSMLDRYEREYFIGLRYLLNDYQKKQYLSLSTRKERDNWLLVFWNSNDPIPSTRKNERKQEHEERVKLAKEKYPKMKYPFVDHRGETLIRFGEPDEIVYIEANLVSAEDNVDYFPNKMPGEIWYYKNLDIIVPFEEVMLNGECIYYMEVNTIDRGMRYLMGRGGGHYLMNIDWFEVNENLNYSPENLLKLEYVALEEVNKFYSLIENDKYYHKPDFQDNPIDFYFDIVRFRGGADKIRTEINIEIPINELTFREIDWQQHTAINIFVSINDMSMNQIISAEKKCDFEFRELEMVRGQLIPAQFTFSLSPGYYRICLEIKEYYSDRRGCYITSKYINEIQEPLGISDLMYASSIQMAEDTDAFVKGTLRVVPHPMHAYKKPNTVKLYYEIYGLTTDNSGLSLYAVEYTVRSLNEMGKNRNIVFSSEYQTTGYSSTQSERIEIGSDTFTEGSYRLSVTVMDRRTREKTTTTSRFSIFE